MSISDKDATPEDRLTALTRGCDSFDRDHLYRYVSILFVIEQTGGWLSSAHLPDLGAVV
jgi:hypothetical protein